MATFNVVLFGASSFVGQILARYLLERHGVGGEVRWAIAGRSKAKLEALRLELGPAAAELPLIIADADHDQSLEDLCALTDVLVSTVGPYALYGSALVKVCAETGTDYLDLAGEPQWIAQMIEQHEAAAKASGARIVHCAGFDSVPSDLGVHFLQQQAVTRFQQPCSRVKLRVKAMRGAASGGTIASMLESVRQASTDPVMRKLLGNPYAFCPPNKVRMPRQPNLNFASYDTDAGAWAAPFVMAGINTKVVHRSNVLTGYGYGPRFVYDEAMLTGKGLRGRLAAVGLAMGIAGFIGAAAIKPSRAFMTRFVLPKAGEGPTPKQQENGFYDIRLFGKTASGEQLSAQVTGDRDPGYGSTAKILGEAAVCLALDISKSDKAGGFWTPATAMGDTLIERLREHAGLTFKLLD